MRNTTNYKRRYKDGGRVLPDGTVVGTPTPDPLHVEIDTPRAHIAADAATDHLLRAVEAGPPAATVDIDHSDDASLAFQRQISALRQSEEIQRQRAAQAAQARSALTKNEIQFLEENPDFLDDHEIAHKALMKAHQGGHVADSDEFHSAVKEHWQALKPPAVKTAPAPDFFEPPEPRQRNSIVSAPPSRDTQANGSYNKYGDRPGRVTLSVAQLEHAKISGLTPREYAEQVIRLREAKENGDYGGRP
jgi:hypothetical protein